MWSECRRCRGLAAISFRSGFHIFRILGPNFGPNSVAFSESFWYPKLVPNPRFINGCCEKVPETGAFSNSKMGPFWKLERVPF